MAVVDVIQSYRDAQQHLSDRDAAAALPLLERVVAEVPDDRSAMRLLALARYATDDLAGAELLLRAIVQSDPVDADAHALLAEVLAASGREEDAATLRAIAERLSPRYSAPCEAWDRSG